MVAGQGLIEHLAHKIQWIKKSIFEMFILLPLLNDYIKKIKTFYYLLENNEL